MGNIKVNDKRKKLLLFSLSLTGVMGLMFFLGTSLSSNTTVKTEDKSAATLTEASLVISNNEKLQQRVAGLQLLDEQYGNAITKPFFSSIADSLNKVILMEENNFRNALETAGQGIASLNNENIKNGFKNMLSAYRSFIDNRKAISSLRNAVAMQSSKLLPDEKMILQLQDELMEKENRINSLESSVKTMTALKAPVAAKAGDNEMLLQNINELEGKVTSLSRVNNNLKEENDRLVKQRAEGVNNNEQMLKEKNISLQQKIEELDAEIQLVKVDCNLNRVDATQIISNSKQRKQLLNEASNILTNLSASGNSQIKRRVNEKINRLNIVAANSRE